jgi:hypothetical protein
MPRDSVDEAKEWHTLNVRESTQSRKKAEVSKMPPSVSVFEAKLEYGASDGQLEMMAPGDGLRAAINVLENDAKYLQQQMRNYQGQDPDSIQFQKFYRGEHLSVVEQLRKIEKDYQGIQNDQKKSISVEEVGQVLSDLFREFRRRLDNMARRCSSMVPPDVAPAVEKAVDREVRTMMGGLNECDYLS